MTSRESGLSLVEVLVGLLLLTVGLLAVAPMFVHGAKVAAASGDMGEVGAEADRRMELLRRTPFNSMPAGGSLSASVSGFSETRPGVIVRWTVTNSGTPATSKTIVVRALADRRVIGLAKEVTFSTRRSR